MVEGFAQLSEDKQKDLHQKIKSRLGDQTSDSSAHFLSNILPVKMKDIEWNENAAVLKKLFTKIAYDTLVKAGLIDQTEMSYDDIINNEDNFLEAVAMLNLYNYQIAKKRGFFEAHPEVFMKDGEENLVAISQFLSAAYKIGVAQAMNKDPSVWTSEEIEVRDIKGNDLGYGKFVQKVGSRVKSEIETAQVAETTQTGQAANAQAAIAKFKTLLSEIDSSPLTNEKFTELQQAADKVMDSVTDISSLEEEPVIVAKSLSMDNRLQNFAGKADKLTEDEKIEFLQNLANLNYQLGLTQLPQSLKEKIEANIKSYEQIKEGLSIKPLAELKEALDAAISTPSEDNNNKLKQKIIDIQEYLNEHKIFASALSSSDRSTYYLALMFFTNEMIATANPSLAQKEGETDEDRQARLNVELEYTKNVSILSQVYSIVFGSDDETQAGDPEVQEKISPEMKNKFYKTLEVSKPKATGLVKDFMSDMNAQFELPIDGAQKPDFNKLREDVQYIDAGLYFLTDEEQEDIEQKVSLILYDEELENAQANKEKILELQGFQREILVSLLESYCGNINNLMGSLPENSEVKRQIGERLKGYTTFIEEIKSAQPQDQQAEAQDSSSTGAG